MTSESASAANLIRDLNDRSREIFRLIVDEYMETGEPVGSRTISRQLSQTLSPATIRNVMSDLEDAGLLFSPHTSAGRLPTESGLRLFIDGLLELGSLSQDEQVSLEVKARAQGRSVNELLEDATDALSGLTRCAGLVFAPKREARLKHIEFISLAPRRALVVIVTDTGMVENRVIDVPVGVLPASLVEAGNYLNSRLVGKTIQEVRSTVEQELRFHRTQLDDLSERVVGAGLATLTDDGGQDYILVRGQANLLENVQGLEDLDRLRSVYQMIETKESMLRLIDATKIGEGVQIFIGSESSLFGLTGCSMIIAPYANSERQMIGAIGVIGPMRMNYARIIPMVDYTSKVIQRLLG